MEFAIAATTLLLTIFAIMNVALAILGYNAISVAAREAVRYAIVHGRTSASISSVQAVAINAAPSLKLTTSNVTVTFPADTAVPSQLDAKVVVSYSYPLKIPFMSAVNLPLSATAQMPVSQ
jgi:Flp pilus assembly protein TadG